MDGLRKVPDNVPNKEMLAAHLGKPLTQVPGPVRHAYPSFGAHNNARLRAFLDTFGFDYEFASLDRLLHVGPASTPRCCGCWSGFDAVMDDHAAVAARGARGDLFAVPADLSAHRHRAARADRRARRQGRHDLL